jgi:radical SAM superfamily enzyme YgiQ (UPF0313 family)
MRIALAFPDLRTAGPIVSGELFVEHLGLGYLSAVLRNDGHETRVVEQYLYGLSDAEVLRRIEVADAMIDAGLRGLVLGFESGAPAVLGKPAKRFDPEDGLRLTRHLRRRGVFVSGNFILGLPWENGETLRQTRDFARRLNLDLCYFNFHKPEPGTPFHRLSVRKGLLDPARYDSGKYDAYAAPLPTLFLTSREMEKASRRFLAAVYLRPTYWLRIAARVLRRPARVMSYAWFARVFVLSGVRWAIATRRAKAFRAAA